MDNKNLYSLEAEQAVLGSLLMENHSWKIVKDELSKGDFYDLKHSLIFDCITEELNAGRECDILVLTEKLKFQDQLNNVGGEAYLFDLAHNTPKTSNINIYASTLRNRTQRRKVFEIGEELKNNACSLELDRVIVSSQQKLIALQKSSDPKKLVAYNLADFLEIQIKPRELLLEPWLPKQGLAMIYARCGIGKTFVGLNVAYAVASGGSFLCWEAKKTAKVLYIDGELPASTIQDRLSNIIQAHDREAGRNLFILTPDMQPNGMPDLSTLEGQQEIEEYVEGVDLIVVDNISTLCRNMKENDAQGWTPVQEWALRMRTLGKSVLFIHHASKTGGQRGTSKKEDILDTVMVLKRPPDYDQKDGAKFEIHFDKSRGFTGEDAEPLLARLTVDLDGKHIWVLETVERSNFDQVVILHNEGLKNNEIAEELGINKSNVSRSLKRARAEGLLNAKPQ